jgi:hypothetical protein
MRTHQVVLSGLLMVALDLPGHAGLAGAASLQDHICEPVESGLYHGQLTKPLKGNSAYSPAEFLAFARNRTWVRSKGVTNVRRRGECGGNCVYKGTQNVRDDEPTNTARVSNAPICDARKIVLETLPAYGVIIGELRFESSTGPAGLQPHGDGAYNVGTGRFRGRPSRLPEHYVVLFPGERLVDRTNYAMWKLVALVGKTHEIVVVDSGLFRVCLPAHPMPSNVLASFRSCAEVAEFHGLSTRLEVQNVVLRSDTLNREAAQLRTFELLVLADSGALARLRSIPDSILFGRRSTGERDEPASGGPSRPRDDDGYPSLLRLLQNSRYGELHPDAPMWYVCANGCCSGQPS